MYERAARDVERIEVYVVRARYWECEGLCEAVRGEYVENGVRVGGVFCLKQKQFFSRVKIVQSIRNFSVQKCLLIVMILT